MIQIRRDYTRKHVICIACIAAISLLLTMVYSDLLLKVDSPLLLRQLSLLIHKPSDYYTNILDNPLEIRYDRAEYITQEFSFKYAGRYVILFNASNFYESDYSMMSHDMKSYPVDARIDFIIGNNMTYSVLSRNAISPVFGKNNKGFALAYFDVPKDLPLVDAIRCKVSINTLGPEFYRYLPLYFVINKISDK